MSQQKLKLFEDDATPIQLTVNSTFAIQYEKKKRGEELSKRTFSFYDLKWINQNTLSLIH
jgi:hypothetical protein